MSPIRLDLSKLLGFKIIAAEARTASNQFVLGAKLGAKPGEKVPVKSEVRIGAKIGGKIGLKGV